MDTTRPVSISLANELWANILQNFTLPPLGPGEDVPDQVFRSNLAALRQLCLTSRRFLALARPYLFQTIILFDEENQPSKIGRKCHGSSAASVVLLLRSLIENHELRPLIKNIALPISLSADRPDLQDAYVAISQAWFDQSISFAQLKPCDQEVFEVAGLVTKVTSKDTENKEVVLSPARKFDGELDTLSQKILAALLCLLPKAERLLLQGLLAKDAQAFDATLWNIISHSKIGPSFLPSLRVLQVQWDSLVLSNDEHQNEQEMGQAELNTPLLNQPGLSRVDLCYAWLNDLAISPRVVQGIAKLRELRLSVAAEPSAVATLLLEATALKTLSLGIFAMPNFPDQEGDLNAAIMKCANTLESLALDTSNCLSDHAAYQLGPLGTLTCLPQLHNLKRLSVEPHLLLDWLNANTWPRFFKTLPPNLEELTLRFSPENGEDLLRIWARSGVGVVLRASPGKWQSKMPRLRHVRLQPLPYSTRAAETLKADLQQSQITLTWQDPDISLDFAGLSLN